MPRSADCSAERTRVAGQVGSQLQHQRIVLTVPKEISEVEAVALEHGLKVLVQLAVHQAGLALDEVSRVFMDAVHVLNVFFVRQSRLHF